MVLANNPFKAINPQSELDSEASVTFSGISMQVRRKELSILLPGDLDIQDQSLSTILKVVVEDPKLTSVKIDLKNVTSLGENLWSAVLNAAHDFSQRASSSQPLSISLINVSPDVQERLDTLGIALAGRISVYGPVEAAHLTLATPTDCKTAQALLEALNNSTPPANTTNRLTFPRFF